MSIVSTMDSIAEIPSPPSSPASRASSEEERTFYRQRNDSEATLVNDLLVLQLAKESKEIDDISQPSLPRMESYNSIAQSNPFTDVHPAFRYNGPDVPQRSTSLLSVESVSSGPPSSTSSTPPPIPAQSHRRSYVSQGSTSQRLSMLSLRSTSSTRTTVTTRDGPRDRYSTKHLLEMSPLDRMVHSLI